jgi:CDP-glucose 4,6-dehydratase
VPDLIRAFTEERPAILRNPASIRPWQHVLEPLNGYLLAIEHIFGVAQAEPLAWNFGPDPAGNGSVADVANAAAAAWGPAARVVVRPDPEQPHESALLQLDSARARADLGWAPRWGFDEAIGETVAWYRAVSGGADARAMCQRQIAAFVAGAE